MESLALFDAGDVIYFVVTIAPEGTGDVTESVTADGASEYSPASAPAAGAGADGGDQPSGNNFVETQGAYSISTVSYLCQITLA